MDSIVFGCVLRRQVDKTLITPINTKGNALAIENEDQYEVKGPDAHAFGKMVENGFIVLAGGTARKEIATSGLKAVTIDGTTLSKAKRVSRNESTPLLSTAKGEQILDLYKKLVDGGQIPTKQQLEKDYSKFRERFQPSVLAGLDGQALLEYMHDHANRDSLVYWLEWKNDDEFNTKQFGRIAADTPKMSHLTLCRNVT